MNCELFPLLCFKEDRPLHRTTIEPVFPKSSWGFLFQLTALWEWRSAERCIHWKANGTLRTIEAALSLSLSLQGEFGFPANHHAFMMAFASHLRNDEDS